jgi:hypothetical protein
MAFTINALLVRNRQRAATEGVQAWVDPEGYREWTASKRRAFEDEVDREMSMTKQSSPATCGFAPLSPDLEVHDRSDLQISEPKVRQESLAYLFERCIELIRAHGRDDS